METTLTMNMDNNFLFGYTSHIDQKLPFIGRQERIQTTMHTQIPSMYQGKYNYPIRLDYIQYYGFTLENGVIPEHIFRKIAADPDIPWTDNEYE